MADYDSGLPIRSEADGTDERVQVKIVDSSNPDTQQATVDTDSNLHVEIHGNDPTNTDRVVRTSEEGHPNTNGLYDATTNTDPSNTALIAHSRNATPGDTQSTERLTSVEDSAGEVRALDISLHDEGGEAYSLSNPLPVSVEESKGDEVVDYQTSSSVPANSSVNHDYTVTAAKTLVLDEIDSTGSGKVKMEVQLETGPATGVFNTVWVGFNSTANPQINLDAKKRIKQVAGAIVRIILTNRDNQPQDLYSTTLGVER